jgi:hypothetical protein
MISIPLKLAGYAYYRVFRASVASSRGIKKAGDLDKNT